MIDEILTRAANGDPIAFLAAAGLVSIAGLALFCVCGIAAVVIAGRDDEQQGRDDEHPPRGDRHPCGSSLRLVEPLSRGDTAHFEREGA